MDSVTVLVSAYALSRKGARIAPVPIELARAPKTLKELIELCAEACVRRYNARASQTEQPLSDEAVFSMSELGKIAFGVDTGGKSADVSEARARALEAFGDGLVRVFLNGSELTELDDALDIKPNDTVSFIRLVMLAGRMW